MKQIQHGHPPAAETNGFAWASLIIGSISLFYYANRSYPHDYLFLSLVLPAAGIATAFLAHHQVRLDARTRGRELATAGAVLSVASIAVLLTNISVP